MEWENEKRKSEETHAQNICFDVDAWQTAGTLLIAFPWKNDKDYDEKIIKNEFVASRQFMLSGSSSSSKGNNLFAR